MLIGYGLFYIVGRMGACVCRVSVGDVGAEFFGSVLHVQRASIVRGYYVSRL